MTKNPITTWSKIQERVPKVVKLSLIESKIGINTITDRAS